MKSFPRINNSANNRIARTPGVRQQIRYSFCYPHRTCRFPRPIIKYRNVPVPVLIVLMHNQLNLHQKSKMEKNENQKWKSKMETSRTLMLTNTKSTYIPVPSQKNKQKAIKGGFPLSRNFYVRTDVNFNWLYVRKLK